MKSGEGRALMEQLQPIQVPSLSLSVAHHQYTVSRDGLLGPHPAQPIVVQKRLSKEVKDSLLHSFLSLPRDALNDMGAVKFVPVAESNYEGILGMLSICDAHKVVCSNLSEKLVVLGSFECTIPFGRSSGRRNLDTVDGVGSIVDMENSQQETDDGGLIDG
jgi:hypothetical protein